MTDPIGDLKEQDFLDWKHHPVTKLLRAYLHDYGMKLRDDHLNGWINSSTVDIIRAADERGRLLTLIEIESLEFDHIVTHFAERAASENQEEPNDPQVSEN